MLNHRTSWVLSHMGMWYDFRESIWRHMFCEEDTIVWHFKTSPVPLCSTLPHSDMLAFCFLKWRNQDQKNHKIYTIKYINLCSNNKNNGWYIYQNTWAKNIKWVNKPRSITNELLCRHSVASHPHRWLGSSAVKHVHEKASFSRFVLCSSVFWMRLFPWVLFWLNRAHLYSIWMPAGW